MKGLRVISDFEWEFQMNQLNRHLAPEIETVYVMASAPVFVSSSGVKEIASFGGKVERLVPDTVARRLAEMFPNGRPALRKTPGSRLRRPMDVLVLIDKLDDLVHKAVPLTDQVRIDREEIYDILDQMRATIPEEIKQARWIVKERQEMLAEAKRETDRILGEAREQAVREASQTEIVKLAERQAQEIVDDSRRQARETRLEMEDWADGILDARGQPGQVPRRGQARPRAAARALAGDRRRRDRPTGGGHPRAGRRRVLLVGGGHDPLPAPPAATPPR